MLALLLAHLVAAVGAPALVRAFGRWALSLLALVPGAAVVWSLASTGPVTGAAVRTEVVSWVPALGLDLAFAMGSLQWVMVLVVAGIVHVVRNKA